MREILFRGKLISGRGWAYGNLVIKPNNISIITPDDTPLGKYGQVIPSTVGQFTGLLDKNGNKIFEGDIVQSCASENEKDWKVWVVKFEDGCFSFESNSYVIKSKRKFRFETNVLCKDEVFLYGLIVIGNIYDNPELLEAGQNGGQYADNPTLKGATK